MGYNHKLWCKAKEDETGRWVEGYYVHLPSGGGSADMIHSPARNPDESNAVYYVDRNTVCQCIGKQDRNGKVLYEGDVIKFHFQSFPTKAFVGIATWSVSMLRLVLVVGGGTEIPFSSQYMENGFEITGNIHD